MSIGIPRANQTWDLHSDLMEVIATHTDVFPVPYSLCGGMAPQHLNTPPTAITQVIVLKHSLPPHLLAGLTRKLPELVGVGL